MFSVIVRGFHAFDGLQTLLIAPLLVTMKVKVLAPCKLRHCQIPLVLAVSSQFGEFVDVISHLLILEQHVVIVHQSPVEPHYLPGAVSDGRIFERFLMTLHGPAILAYVGVDVALSSADLPFRRHVALAKRLKYQQRGVGTDQVISVSLPQREQ